MTNRTASTAAVASSAPEAARWQDYFQLLKPRVMSLVVFTAVTGLVCAPAPAGRSPLNPGLAAVALLCIAVGAGAAGAFNMWYEADIDALMRRTRHRPLPLGRVQPSDALALSVLLGLFSTMLLGLAANWLAAALLAFTIAFYALVYTVWLKRRTAQNIVIGGLAGALPPLVGWTAASGSLALAPLILVAIIFLWTPPHFWALSLVTREDYARAGVPMLPVVSGEAATRRRILAYALVMAPTGLAPAFMGLGGWPYLVIAAAAGAGFVALAARLAGASSAEIAAKRAKGLFAFSIAYLFLLFAALLIEHLAGVAPLTAPR
ncbi:MAG TPA: heme o synthase [Caulobacteraceae bacterium]|nr:heme o synthase [Caulobacteraceae bacterium]